MMKLTAYRQIKDVFYADLEAVFAKHGLAASKINAGIDEMLGTVKLNVQLRDANLTDKTGAATTPERERFKQHGSVYGLKPEWLDRDVIIGGKHFTVAGLKPRGDKCVLLKHGVTGKMHVAVPAYLVAVLGRAS